MKEVFNKILPGLIPLVVFIIADAIWGPQVGVVVALIIGVIELLIVYIKDHKWDRFILLDTGILILFSSLSLITHDDVFFKLKPAFMESFLLIILGISLFTSKNLLLMMSRRFMPADVGKEQEHNMIQMIRPLFWLMLVHIIMTVYSAYYMSSEWWGFISGILFYVMIVAYFAFVVLKNRWMAKRGFSSIEFYDLSMEMKLVKGRFTPQCLQVRLYLWDDERSVYFLPNPNASSTSFVCKVGSEDEVKKLISGWIGNELQLEAMDVHFVRRYALRAEQDEIVFVFLGKISEKDIKRTRVWKGYSMDSLSNQIQFDLTQGKE
ncbi:septation protein IspZ [Prolixibacteraceae bacterium]|nr:septation protein IspZ [Prolixibacteraceae bacterium]